MDEADGPGIPGRPSFSALAAQGLIQALHRLRPRMHESREEAARAAGGLSDHDVLLSTSTVSVDPNIGWRGTMVKRSGGIPALRFPQAPAEGDPE